MHFGALVAYAGGLQVSTVVMMNVINSGLSMLAGTVVIGQGVYFGGRLVYRIVESTSGFIIEKINHVRDSSEMIHTTVSIEGEEFELLDHHEIIEINAKDLTQEMLDKLPNGKLLRIVRDS